VSFAAGIAPSDVTWQRNGNDLLLRVGGGTDQINISSFYDLRLDRGGYMVNGVTVPPQGIVSTSSGFPSYVAPSRVELVQFADGTVWDASYFGAPLLGDFRVDTYRFGRGAGEVSVIDFDFWQSNATRELDSILIAADLSPSDLTVSRVGDDLALAVNGTTDSLTIQSFFKTVTVIPPFSSSGYAVAVYQIEQVQFANGTVWTVSDLNSRIATFIGTPGADTLFGNQNDNLIQGLSGDDFLSGQGGHDVLDGGAGNDRLFGDTGSDTYLFGCGGGQDILVSYDSTGTEIEVVRLGSDVLPADVTIQVVGTSNDLVLRINGTNDQLLLDEFLWRSDYQIDWLEFGDGTLWDTAMILNRAMGLTLVGTDMNNTLRGSMLDDVLDGVGGNDLLVGNEGDDRLIGGVGDDELSGDAGDDTYVFNLGDGVDTVYDEVAPGEANRIQFGAGIAQSDLAFIRDESARTLTIQVGGGADQLRLMDFDPTGADGSLVVETLVFADGSMLNLTELYPPVTNHAPTLATPLADQIVPEDAPFSIQIPTNSFADQDTNDVLTYGASLADGNTLPSWLMFNVTTQTFTGLADDAQVGNLDLSVTVTDSEGLSASDAFTLTVQNVNDAPIVAVPLADQTGAEDEPFSFTVPAGTFADEDGIHGDTLSYRASLSDGRALPAWLSFNPVTRTFTGTPGAGTAGMLQLAVTATDTGALTTTDVFALTISGPLPKTFIGTAGNDVLMGARGNDTLRGLGGQDTLYGKEGNDWLDGGSGSDTLVGGMGDDTYVVNATGDVVTELAGEGLDTVRTSLSSYTLGAHLENLTLTGGITSVGVGNALNNTLVGDAGSNLLSGGAGNDVLQGGAGIDALAGGTGNDLYQFFRGDGRDVIRDKDTTAGNQDRLAFGTTINPLDLILERQANDLRLRVYGSQDQVLIDSWYSAGTANQVETLQVGNGQTLLSSQVDQLIQAMATFTQQTGLTWDQAIDQRPQDVQAVLAGSWQG
ncbi:MAG TPA: calcium-binding protein, partial [Nitrospira sp.]|nr:calcium-binding protein [Nitrospira sp.]